MPFDVEHMQRALELAAQARGCTSPNPMVGCVAVRDGVVIGEGFHRRAGDAHAEVAAIGAAGGDVAGATLYVTLEPCVHHGRTPPCVDLLLENRPGRVVVAMEDPNPRVAGRGIAALREAGIEVETGLLEAEARRLNEAYIKYITTGRPLVIAKCAMTLDGKLATRTGASKWITGEAARSVVHRVRSEVDAILVGRRTVDLDDPSLTARTGSPEIRQPTRIVVSKSGALDGRRKVFSEVDKVPTLVVAPLGARVSAGCDVITLPADDAGDVEWSALMDELGRREITSVLIEGGGETLASAFAAGVVDKVMFFVAPKIVGGRDAVTAVEGDGVASLDEAVLLERMQATRVGEDLLIEAYVKSSELCLPVSSKK